MQIGKIVQMGGLRTSFDNSRLANFLEIQPIELKKST